MRNAFYFGDNLHVMQEYLADTSVDLVYLDPPFNSNATYNLLFKSPDRSRWSDAQITTFDDTWSWGELADAQYRDLTHRSGRVGEVMAALHRLLGPSDMLAYLTMMAARLVELHRVLKPTGSLYLHCDPTASHYLKIILDGIFGPEMFRNEIVWRRNAAKGLATRRLPRNHDVLLVYAKSSDAVWNNDAAFLPYDRQALPEKTLRQYSHVDSDGRSYQLTSLLNPNADRANLTYEFLGVTRVWRWTRARMQAAYEAGLIRQSGPGRVPRLVRYLDEQRGLPLDDIWSDVAPLQGADRERLGYPTQKPSALIERVIRLSTHPEAVVLDPFCGCGTTLHAAHGLGRSWVGIDVSVQAMTVVGDRLHHSFPGIDYDVFGIPTTLEGAHWLAAADPFKFEEWAVSRIGAMHSGRFRGDGGIDGTFFFLAGKDRESRGIVSVKAGRSLNPGMVRDLVGTLRRERDRTDDPLSVAVLISAHEPTEGMRREALAAGVVATTIGEVPAVQILSIRDILEGRTVRVPVMFDSVSAASANRRRGTTGAGYLDPAELARQRAMLLAIPGGAARAPVAAKQPMPARKRA